MARDEWDSARAEWEASSNASSEWDTYVPPENDTPGRSVEERTPTPATGAQRARGRIIAAAVVAALVGAGGLGGALSQGDGDEAVSTSVQQREVVDSPALDPAVLARALGQAAAEAESSGAAPYKVYLRHDVVTVEMVDEAAGVVRTFQETDLSGEDFRIVVDEYDGDPYEPLDLAAVDPSVVVDLVGHVLESSAGATGFDVVIGENSFDEGDIIVGSWGEAPVHVLATIEGDILREDRGD